jgi:hypothetical protein
MNILAILGIGGALYAIFKSPASPQPSQAIVDKATEIARLQMIEGVPQNIAVAATASQAPAMASAPTGQLLQFKPGYDKERARAGRHRDSGARRAGYPHVATAQKPSFLPEHAPRKS